MPMFRVEATRTNWPKDFNPFRLRSAELMSGKVGVSIKTWEFEAKNKAEVEQLWQAALDNGVSQIQGYKLGSITEIEPATTLTKGIV